MIEVILIPNQLDTYKNSGIKLGLIVGTWPSCNIIDKTTIGFQIHDPLPSFLVDWHSKKTAAHLAGEVSILA